MFFPNKKKVLSILDAFFNEQIRCIKIISHSEWKNFNTFQGKNSLVPGHEIGL